jgi:DNA-binding response OmpR family regulator
VMMPGVDGIEVCRQIDHEHVGVVMLSARDDADTRERATAAGAEAYLTKPFSAIELLDAIEAATRR